MTIVPRVNWIAYPRRFVWLAATIFCLVFQTPPVRAQSLSNPTDPRLGFNALEQAAARANQATYDRLQPLCGGTLQDPACTPDVLRVFAESQRLVHTANEILGSGPTEFSLGLDAEGLGFALQWTAAEEMAAQGSLTTVFAASQLSSLSARISALRWGVNGPRSASLSSSGEGVIRVADGGSLGRQGGGASADAESVYSRWNWYVDGSYGYGEKDPTVLENAFDFDGQEVTVGLDYRFSPSLVTGAMLGHTTKEVDFDSSQSIVDGAIESDGYSLIVYGLWEGDHAYLTTGIGYQQLSHDTRRRITYPSQNPLVRGANSLATSSTDSDGILAMVGGGYAWRWSGFSIEPMVELAYVDTTVDGFEERSVNLVTDSEDDPFDLRLGEQSIESLGTAAGFKVDYVFTPGFGVVVPYVIGRYHRELLNDVRRISARYADAYELLLRDVAGDPNFNVPTDEPDDDYYTIAGGLTVVLQGGMMGFVQYMEVLDLDNYTDSVITGGIRYEFGR